MGLAEIVPYAGCFVAGGIVTFIVTAAMACLQVAADSDDEAWPEET